MGFYRSRPTKRLNRLNDDTKAVQKELQKAKKDGCKVGVRHAQESLAFLERERNKELAAMRKHEAEMNKTFADWQRNHPND